MAVPVGWFTDDPKIANWFDPLFSIEGWFDPLLISGPSVGAVSATLDAVTTTATGTISLSGAFSNTLGALTLSGTGALAVVGTFSGTLGAVTLTSTANPSIAGALSQTLGTLTGSGTSALAIAGATGGQLADLTLVATGELGAAPNTGQVDAALSDVTLVASGTMAGETTPLHGKQAKRRIRGKPIIWPEEPKEEPQPVIAAYTGPKQTITDLAPDVPAFVPEARPLIEAKAARDAKQAQADEARRRHIARLHEEDEFFLMVA